MANKNEMDFYCALADNTIRHLPNGQIVAEPTQERVDGRMILEFDLERLKAGEKLEAVCPHIGGKIVIFNWTDKKNRDWIGANCFACDYWHDKPIK